jgi:hypothetical protein
LGGGAGVGAEKQLNWQQNQANFGAERAAWGLPELSVTLRGEPLGVSMVSDETGLIGFVLMQGNC